MEKEKFYDSGEGRRREAGGQTDGRSTDEDGRTVGFREREGDSRLL